ncbi:phage protease [Rhizobium paknamense]|uniref:Phage I-like protein n=1 Tax=Rhizobium paknamense TaxID=1206817 RepID=A0ABU0I8V9_9HYPH|nr:phage protease [Rhizobium paknamense]MDQ0454647.1 phage I-like protein [Rhizobium paknamense]
MTKNTQTHPSSLIATHAVMLGGADAVSPEEGSTGHWTLLMPLGSFSGRDGRGPYSVNGMDGMQAVIAATAQRAGTTDLVVDYDHQTQFSAVPGVGGQAPAAGWIKQLEARPDGLYGRIEWTEKAVQSIRAGEYRYISPAYHHDPSGRVLRLISAGLTNVPNLDLAAVAASAQQTRAQQNQENDMKTIAAALGLSEDADESAILTAINSVLTGNAAIAAAAGLSASAKPTEIVTAIQSARSEVDPTRFVPIEQVTALQNGLKALQTKIEGEEAEIAVHRAITEGRLAPALKNWGLDLHKKDPAAFKAFADASPVLTATQRAGVAPPGTGADTDLTSEDLAVMSQMGLSKETFLKAKKGGDA